MTTVTYPNPLSLVKRVVFLAWKACGNSSGMGFLQDRGPDQTEDQIWESACNKHDYGGFGGIPTSLSVGFINCDYVQGRMMKLYINWGKGTVTLPGSKPTFDYQSWCCVYPTYNNLLQSAVNSL